MLVLTPSRLHSERYVFENYFDEAGLWSDKVRALYQDGGGYLWVGTNHGVFRYDGGEFRAYGRKDSKPVGVVWSITEAPNGAILVATTRHLLHLEDEGLVPVRLPRAITISAGQCLAADFSGRLYLGTDEGLLIGEPDGGESKPGYVFRTSGRPVESPESRMAGLWVDTDGALWFSHANRLCRMRDGDVSVFGADAGLPEERWLSVVREPQGTLWARGKSGVYGLHPGSRRFEKEEVQFPQSPTSLLLALGPGGELVAPSSDGLWMRAAGRWTAVTTKDGLVSNRVRAFLAGRDGSVWLGYANEGLARWLGYGEWSNWTTKDGLSGNSVAAIERDEKGSLWVGTLRGLDQWDITRGKEHFRHWGPKQGLPEGRIWSIASIGQGRVLVGTAGQGLYVIDTNSERAWQPDWVPALSQGGVRSIAAEPGGPIWVCGGRGFYRVTAAGDTFESAVVAVPGMRPDAVIYQALVDRTGSVWLASSDGLVRKTDDQWRRFTTRDGLKSDALRQLAEGPGDEIWVAYNDQLGLSRLSVTTDEVLVAHVTTGDALASDDVRFLGRDYRGWMWVGTSNGVDVFNG
ncbi:MAG: hypothetical protein GY953_35215, partial [bacterium]|nr:hypothetical protein [bacterium]